MILKNITITNFKSIYGTEYFDFEQLHGLVKLSGPIGVGKTTLAEAILYGLFGAVKEQNVTELVAWNEKSCTVELNIVSHNKDIHIIRNTIEPLIVEINGKVLSASNKRNTQQILEEEIYDVPKLAIMKMCVISFNQFKSLVNMNPADTKQFLDDIFGFKLFTQYNDEIVNERKAQINELTKLNAIAEETENHITNLKEKKAEQERQITSSVDLQKYQQDKLDLIEQGKQKRNEFNNVDNEYKLKEKEIDDKRLEHYNKRGEYGTLGKQEKNFVNTFKNGKCPTCGHDIDESIIEEHRVKMNEYADLYRAEDTEEKKYANELSLKKAEHSQKLIELNKEMDALREKIHQIDSEVAKYNSAIKLISENYDSLIKESENKYDNIKKQIDKLDHEIGEWNDMSELFTKTLRYKLLDTLIPHINSSIQYYINKLDQSYKIQFDQTFKAHIFVDSYSKEISYNNLSTGQRKSLDVAVIFGILQNVITSVNFNVFVLDELFSNMDVNTRNIMLELLQESMSEDKSIFIINHAEMNDDYFQHKIRVSLHPKVISTKKTGKITVKASKYEYISI